MFTGNITIVMMVIMMINMATMIKSVCGEKVTIPCLAPTDIPFKGFIINAIIIFATIIIPTIIVNWSKPISVTTVCKRYNVKGNLCVLKLTGW